MDDLRARYNDELLQATKRVREEAQPTGDMIYDDVFTRIDGHRDPASMLPKGQ